MLCIIDGFVFVVTWDGMEREMGCDGNSTQTKKTRREQDENLETYLVRFLCAEFNICGMNIAITDSPHSQRGLGKWLVRFVWY